MYTFQLLHKTDNELYAVETYMDPPVVKRRSNKDKFDLRVDR